jgi:hypothetical protein
MLLVVGHFTNNKRSQFSGRAMLAVSCGISAFSFFYTQRIWFGMAFALPAITLTFALIAFTFVE